MSSTEALWRTVMLVAGTLAAGLGAYGAFEYQLKLEGGTLSYLVIAAPLVAASAALIPVFVEILWREGARFKAVCWVFALIPATLVVFLSVTERVHYAKAGAEAERSAAHSSLARAEKSLDEAKLAASNADKNAAHWRSQKVCGASCRLKHDEAAKAAWSRVALLEQELRSVERGAVKAAPLQVPPWLLPVALDLFAFLAIWSGLAPFSQKVVPDEPKAKTKQTRKPTRKPRQATRKAPQPTRGVPLKLVVDNTKSPAPDGPTAA